MNQLILQQLMNQMILQQLMNLQSESYCLKYLFFRAVLTLLNLLYVIITLESLPSLMKDSEIQLRETLKILAFEFISSIEKMVSLYGEHLSQSRHTLFPKIIELLKFNHAASEDYSRLLENSQDEGAKYGCFEKDLSVSVHNSHSGKEGQSDMESEMDTRRKGSLDNSIDKIKKEFLNYQRFTQTTKYTGNPNEIFQYIDSFEDECKKEELTPIDKLRFHPEISESVDKQIDQDKIEESDQQIPDECDSEEEENSEESDSSFTPQGQSEIINLDEQKDNFKANKLNLGKRQVPRSTFKSKKYHSYTENQKIQAIKYASEFGFDFSSKVFKIPKKNITRWMKTKQPLKIRGRKPGDPAMEQNLTSWIKQSIIQGQYVTQNEIREKAREFADSKNFKASKGWLEKYFRRNRVIGKALNRLLQSKKAANAHKALMNLKFINV